MNLENMYISRICKRLKPVQLSALSIYNDDDDDDDNDDD